MALLNKVESAMLLNITVELLEYFVSYAAKGKNSRKLKVEKRIDGEWYFLDSELNSFRIYLSEPWPKPDKGQRPYLPENIKDDVKHESHHGCAICGLVTKCEVAHIEASKDSYNNSPDNLLLLCSNHHTDYDYGNKVDGVNFDVVLAAKTMKRASRSRIMQYEKNSIAAYKSLLNLIKSLEFSLGKDPAKADVILVELKSLLSMIPEFEKRVEQEFSVKDKVFSPEDKYLKSKLAEISVAIAKDNIYKDTSEVKKAATNVNKITDEILLEFDEHTCPHCSGAGTMGLMGDICFYCKGEQLVTKNELDSYNVDNIDYKLCPKCNGSGQQGIMGRICSYCKGSIWVTPEKFFEYDDTDEDEVECPCCFGSGTIGLEGNVCPFCKGDQVVSSEKNDSYDECLVDLHDCPHCNGTGVKGFTGSICSYCKGDQRIKQSKVDSYDPSKIDEVLCPKCKGSGQQGLAGTLCKLCKGDQVVKSEVCAQYIAKYGDD